MHNKRQTRKLFPLPENKKKNYCKLQIKNVTK